MKRFVYLYILFMFLVPLNGCNIKSVTTKEALNQKPRSFDEFLNQTLCEDIPFLGKDIKTQRGIYSIRECKKIRGVYRVGWIGKDIRPLFNDLMQEYCQSLNGILVGSLGSIDQLKNTPFFQLYKQKEEAIYGVNLPGYYKKVLVSEFRKKFIEVFNIYFTDRYRYYNTSVCLSPSESFSMYYRYKPEYNKCCYYVEYRKIDPEKITEIIARAYEQAQIYTRSRILEDKQKIFWYGDRVFKGNVMLKDLKVIPSQYRTSEFKIKFVLVNKRDVPYLFNLRNLSFLKNNKEFPVILKSAVFGCYGNCEMVSLNKTVIPPDGECRLELNEVKFLGVSDLTDGLLAINNFLIHLKKTNKYEENIRKK